MIKCDKCKEEREIVLLNLTDTKGMKRKVSLCEDCKNRMINNILLKRKGEVF